MTTGLQREQSDAFYTKPRIAKTLIDKVHKLYNLSTFNTIIEPSAGAGAFSDELRERELQSVILAYDINPKKPYIKKQDYLSYVFKPNKTSNTLVIGNPPFGRQSTLAQQFIQKSCEFADVIAFILPKSFKKERFKQFFPLSYHLTYQSNIPYNSFLIDNKEYDVPCIFQIWEKRDNERKLVKTEHSKYFTFVNKDENPHFAIRRIGVYAGKLSQSAEDKSHNSHYYVKVNKGVNRRAFVDAYNSIEFKHDNTVGPKSISKPELIKKVNGIHLPK